MNSARLVPAISAAFDWESSPCEYQNIAAATRISFTNSAGDRRSADSAPSGTSMVIVGTEALDHQDTALSCCWEMLRPYTQTGRPAPREVLPIVSRLSADR